MRALGGALNHCRAFGPLKVAAPYMAVRTHVKGAHIAKPYGSNPGLREDVNKNILMVFLFFIRKRNGKPNIYQQGIEICSYSGTLDRDLNNELRVHLSSEISLKNVM